jgi:hypothetical protein
MSGGPAAEAPSGIFDALRGFLAAADAFSEEAARELIERREEEARLAAERAESLAEARELSAAKYLAQNVYLRAQKRQEDFVRAYGKRVSEFTEKEIGALFDNDYFTDRIAALGFFKDGGKGAAVNRRDSLIRAQSAMNIPITAKLDLNTKRALIEGTDVVPKDTFSSDSPVEPAPESEALPVPPVEYPEGMWVLINKSSRILTVYIGKEVFRKYPIAVGSNPSLTPNGQFTFVVKYVNPRWGGGGYAAPVAGGSPSNPLGKRWLGISKGGGGRYGVHGNASPNSIGTNASHGCVRMINSDVEELYEVIEIGTPIWIGANENLAEWGISQTLEREEPARPDYRTFLQEAINE